MTDVKLPRDEIVALIPSLRAFARSLTRNATDADDLVQETLLKAYGNLDKFTPGTQLRQWLFTIMRNAFYSGHRKHGREVTSAEDGIVDRGAAPPEQEWSVYGGEIGAALASLSDDQRQALMLVGAMGVSYEEAAEVCGCAVGTMKSRVNRGRSRLAALLGLELPTPPKTTTPTRPMTMRQYGAAAAAAW